MHFVRVLRVFVVNVTVRVFRFARVFQLPEPLEIDRSLSSCRLARYDDAQQEQGVRASDKDQLRLNRVQQHRWRDVECSGKDKRHGEQGVERRCPRGASEVHGCVLPSTFLRTIAASVRLVEHLDVPADPFDPGVEGEDGFEHRGEQQQRQQRRERSRGQGRRGDGRRGPRRHSRDEEVNPGRAALSNRRPELPVFVLFAPCHGFRAVSR